MLFPDLDPRIAKWPFMQSSIPVLLIVLSYLLSVKLLVPAYMKNRRPHNLRIPMILHNTVMVVYSAWMFYKFGVHGWFGKYSYMCEPVNYSEDEDSMGMVVASWHFFFSKLVELLDTVFFVLRKKDNHVTYLHIVHHAWTPLGVWVAIIYGAGGYNTLFGFANSFVHIWTYLYYALAALGPSVQKYLWWKRYLTTLQLVQFVFILTTLLNQALNPACETNSVLIVNQLGTAFIFLVLFINFYINAYRKKSKRGREKERKV